MYKRGFEKHFCAMWYHRGDNVCQAVALDQYLNDLFEVWILKI